MKVENIDDTKNIDTRSAVQAYLGQQTDPAQSAHQSFATSVGTNPDYEVELRRVAARTGVPVDSARAYPDEVKRKAQLKAVDFQAMQTKYPTTVNFMADRNNAQVAHDDLDGLQGVEDTLKPADRTFLEGLWQPIASGWNATVAGFGLTMGDALTPSGLEAKRKLAAEQGGVDYTPDIERAVKQAQLERTAQKYSAPADIQQGMQEIGGAQTFGYALEAALSSPRATLETALQSLGASAPALLMAAGGATLGPAGTATGAGLGSFSIEYASTVRDVMTASGVNMTDPVQLADGLNNSELMSQARDPGRGIGRAHRRYGGAIACGGQARCAEWRSPSRGGTGDTGGWWRCGRSHRAGCNRRIEARRYSDGSPGGTPLRAGRSTEQLPHTGGQGASRKGPGRSHRADHQGRPSQQTGTVRR